MTIYRIDYVNGSDDIRATQSGSTFSIPLTGINYGSNIAPLLTTGNWTPGTRWRFLTSPDRLEKFSTTAAGIPTTTLTVVSGRAYKVTIIFDAASGGTFTITMGGQTYFTVTSAGTYSGIARTTSTAALTITGATGTLGIVSSVVVAEMDWNGDYAFPVNVTTSTPHGLTDGSSVYIASGSYTGIWLIKNVDSNNYTLHTSHPKGIIRVWGTPVEDETFLIGTQSFTFKTTRSGYSEAEIGTNQYETVKNIQFAINTDIGGSQSNYIAVEGNVSMVTNEPYVDYLSIYYLSPGISGNTVSFTASATGVSFGGTGSLYGGADSSFLINDNKDVIPSGGGSWADALKTTGTGLTTTKIAPSDVVLVARTDDPVQITGITASFTDLSQTVTLNTAVTADIEQAIGSSGWTASTSVTKGTDTTRKIGANSLELTFADAFTTGKVAYKSFATKDLSAYEQISFWFYASTTNVSTTTGVYQIKLCSDEIGNVAVDTFDSPIMSASSWNAIVIDKGSALGSAIKSVAIYITVDPVTTQCRIQNIMACKASDDPSCITLQTIIGNNNNDWYGIQSIIDTTIKIDSANTAATGRGYQGTTGDFQLWKLPYIEGGQIVLPESGTIGNLIEAIGGWNPTTSVREYFTAYSAPIFNRTLMSTFRQYVMYRHFLAACYSSFFLYGAGAKCVYYYDIVLINSTSVISVSNYQAGSEIHMINCKFLNLGGFAAYAYTGCSGKQILNKYKNITGVGFRSAMPDYLTDCEINNCGTALDGYEIIYLTNCLVENCDVEYPASPGMEKFKIQSLRHDDTDNNHWILGYGYTINMQTATKGGSGVEWKVIILGSYRNEYYPVDFELAKIPVKASIPVTVKIYCTKDHATDVTAKLMISDHSEILNTESYVIKDNNTNREQLTLTFTPSKKGVVSLTARSYYNTGLSNIYWDTVTIE